LKKEIGFLFTDQKSFNELELLFDFNQFKNEYSFKYIFGRGIIDPTKNYTQVLFGNFSIRAHALIHNLLIWKNRKATLSFKLRAFNMFGNNSQHNKWTSFLNYDKKRVSSVKRLFVRSLGNSFGILIISAVINILFFYKQLNIQKNFGTYNCILLSYGGRPSVQQDFLVWYARKKNFPTIAVQENWDNLTSKSVLFKHPDYFATWGKQSTAHLRQIHNFKGQVREIGNLKLGKFYTKKKQLDIDFSNSNRSLPNNNLAFKNILIIGTSWGDHALNLIKECADIIDANTKKFTTNLRIVYRPHPYGRIQSGDLIQISKIQNVIIDKPTKYEDNEYRISLLLNSSFIISLYSTVMLEASILNIPCIIPSFLNVSSSYDIKNFLDESDYFKGTSSLEGIFNPTTREEFIEILKLSNNPGNLKIANSNELLNWFCSNTNTSDEIFSLIEKATSSIDTSTLHGI